MEKSDLCKVLNLEVIEVDTFFSRFKGLMFKRKKLDYGMLFENTNGIHTFFMFQNIDVVLFDKFLNAIFVYENVKPWRVILPKKNVKYTLEIPVGYGKFFKSEKYL